MNRCPKCNGSTYAKVSRVVGIDTYRLRVCPKCGKRIYTRETIIDDVEGYDAISNHEKDRNRKYRLRKGARSE